MSTPQTSGPLPPYAIAVIKGVLYGGGLELLVQLLQLAGLFEILPGFVLCAAGSVFASALLVAGASLRTGLVYSLSLAVLFEALFAAILTASGQDYQPVRFLIAGIAVVFFWIAFLDNRYRSRNKSA